MTSHTLSAPLSYLRVTFCKLSATVLYGELFAHYQLLSYVVDFLQILHVGLSAHYQLLSYMVNVLHIIGHCSIWWMFCTLLAIWWCFAHYQLLSFSLTVKVLKLCQLISRTGTILYGGIYFHIWETILLKPQNPIFEPYKLKCSDFHSIWGLTQGWNLPIFKWVTKLIFPHCMIKFIHKLNAL